MPQPLSWLILFSRPALNIAARSGGLSLECAAELAGLEMSEWAALESGWVPNPDDLALIRSIAGTLEVSWVDFSFLALMAACQRPHPEESAGQA